MSSDQRNDSMIQRTHSLVTTLLLVGSILLLTGCATTPTTARVRPNTLMLMGAIQSTGVPTLQITLNQLSAGGVREKRDDWTDAARDNAIKTLAGIRPGQLVIAREVELNAEVGRELAEVQALYRAVDANLVVFGNPIVRLPTLEGRFNFSVGSVDRICDALGVDSLLLIYGEDDYFTGQRKALVALGIVAAAFTGVVVTPSAGAEHVSAALIARDGSILWRDVAGPGRIKDLREANGVDATLGELLRTMPVAGGRSS